MELRLGIERDIEHIVNMCESFAYSSPYRDYVVFSQDKTRETIKALITNPNGLVLLLVSDDHINKPVGMLLAVSTELLFSSDRMSTEIAWWVDPEYRGKDSIQLLDAYEYWARVKKNCKIIQMVCLEGFDLSKLYERRGYKRAETMYMKELN